MTRPRLRPLISWPAIVALAMIAAVEWFLIVVHPEDGIPGTLQIVAPHLALAAVALVPFALIGRRRSGTIAVVVLLAAVAIRFGDDWVSLPAPAPVAGSTALKVMTWNLEADARSGADTVAMLLSEPVDVAGLQELGPEAAAAIEASPALVATYPYRVLVPREDFVGLGLLSRFPISNPTFQIDPAIQQAAIEIGPGRSISILNAHPLHADIAHAGRRGPPIGFDATQRDADLVTIRQRVDAQIGARIPAILLGDLNTAATEPAFDRLVAGLLEVHRAVGEGPGWTWRPIALEFLGSGLLRIDHVIVSPDIEPLTISGQCPAIGDHCLVEAGLAIPPRPSG